MKVKAKKHSVLTQCRQGTKFELINIKETQKNISKNCIIKSIA